MLAQVQIDSYAILNNLYQPFKAIVNKMTAFIKEANLFQPDLQNSTQLVFGSIFILNAGARVPFVLNTEEEVKQVYSDFRTGQF